MKLRAWVNFGGAFAYINILARLESSAAGVLDCRQAKDLLHALGEAVRKLVKLHEEKFESLIGGDLGE